MNWNFALLLNSIRSLHYQEFGFELTRSIGSIIWFLDVLNLCCSQTWTEFRNGWENGHITCGLVVNSTFSYRHQKQFSLQDMREVTDLIHGLRSSKVLTAFRDKSYLKGHISWIINTFHYPETGNVHGTPSIQKQAKIQYRCRYDHGNPYSGFGFYLTRNAHQKVYTGLP